jgi:hypothetical protein
VGVGPVGLEGLTVPSISGFPEPRYPGRGRPSEQAAAPRWSRSRPTILDIETLNGISASLYDQADQITQITLQDLALNLRLAARCATVLAHVRFELGEIAEKTKDHDTRLEIRGLLDDAGVAEPQVGQP